MEQLLEQLDRRGGSYEEEFSYDPRAVDSLVKLLNPLVKPDFQQWFNDAADYYRFYHVDVSQITSWEQFAIYFNSVNKKVSDYMFDLQKNRQDRFQEDQMQDARNLVMFAFVVKTHLPDKKTTVEQMQALARYSRIDIGTQETSLQLFDDTVPLEVLPMVHQCVHDVYNLLQNPQFKDPFGTVDSRNERLMSCLKNRWDLCAVLPKIRTFEDDNQNPINISIRRLKGLPYGISYLLCLYYVNPDDLDKLLSEMTVKGAKLVEGLDKTSLKDWHVKLDFIDNTCKSLANYLTEITFTIPYFINSFELNVVVKFINSPLIAKALLQLHDENRDDTRARSELDLIGSYKKIQILLEICENIQFFKDGWLLGYVSGLRKSAKLRESEPQLTIEEKYERIKANKVGIFASFLKETQHNVRLGISDISDDIKRLERKSTLRNINSQNQNVNIGDKRKGEDDAKDKQTDSEMLELDAMKSQTDAPKQAARLQKIGELLTAAQQFIVSQMPTLKQINSNTEATGQRIKEQADYAATQLRRVGSSLTSGAIGLVGSAWNGTKGVFNSAVNYITPEANRSIAFEPRYPVASNASIAGNGTPAPNRTSRPNDRSKKEIQLSGKTGGGSNNVRTSSFTPPPPPPALVYPSQNDFKKTYGLISNLHHVPSNKLPITFTPPYVQPIAAGGSRASNPNVFGQPVGGSRAHLYIQNPVGGGSMASSSINPNNVKDRTSTSSNINSINFSYERPDIYGKESLEPTPASSPKRGNSIQGSKGGKPKHSMSKNKKTLRRNPRKLISRRQKYSRRK